MNNSKIPNQSVLKISLIETFEANPAIKLIGKLEITNPQAFPISYELEYDEKDFKNLGSIYYLNVTIKKDRVNLYSNESKASFKTLSTNEFGDLLGKAGRLRRHLDVYLNTLNVK
jgi:uncharacterized lipoprotein YbaY